MNDKQMPEVVEKDLEIAPQHSVELNQSKFDAIIKFAEQTEKIGRSLDNIRKFTLSRALPGDWVRHGDNLNLTGPAAERILSALGLMGISASFTNWKYWKDNGVDKNGEWFCWFYEADIEIGGLRVEKVQGRAGSRDQFFGYAHGAWKDLSDVKEADIRMAARRGVIKEGVKLALGLRSIPADAAASLGLDVTKIKPVEYGKGGKTETGAPPAVAGTALGVKSVNVRQINKKDGTKTSVFVIEDERGTKYETFSETIAIAAKEIKASGKKALFDHEANGKYAPKLKALTTVGVEVSESEPLV